MNRRRLLGALAWSLLAMSGFGPRRLTAQELGGFDFASNDAPIAIEADEGIEWRRSDKTYIARGNAKVTRGNLTLTSEIITAHYREENGQDATIYRVEAEGGVTLTSPSERVFGDKMVYDLDRAVVIITGGDLKIETAKQVVTADESLEYWQRELAVVARGNAKVVEEGRTVSADTLTGYMKSDSAGKNALYQVEAQGNVRIQRGDEIVRCNSAVYNLDSGIATLSGGVKISQGGNQLNGDYAEINLNTGVSRLLGNPNGGRVQSLILPGSKPTAPQPSP